MELKHPSHFLRPEWISIIRDAAATAELAGMLEPCQLELIYRQGWFKLLAPIEYGGLQAPLPELLCLEEALSWANGSLGWVVTLCCGAGWFGGFLNPAIAPAIFENEKVCLAGSGAPTGTAAITNNGYLINGRWKYASGAHHATHLTANCIIKKDGEAVLNKDGNALILPFIFDRKDVAVLPAWKHIGMVATGSDAFEINELFVEPDRCFKIAPEAALIDSPLYSYPFLQLAETTLAVNLSGMAIHFVDLCEPIFEDRIKNKKFSNVQARVLTDTLSSSGSTLNQARQSFFEAAELSWQGDNLKNENLLKGVSNASRRLAKIALGTVDNLYPFCGLVAAHAESDINRVWRDIHTASQHALLTFPSE